jgi:hypothetical protein
MSVKMNKKRIKKRLTAGLDKVGFIEAQALAWVTPKKRVRPVGARETGSADRRQVELHMRLRSGALSG